MKLTAGNIKKRTSKGILLPIISSVVAILLIVLDIMLGYPPALNNTIGFLVVMISAFLSWIYRYNIGLFLVMVFIAYTNYSIVCAVYFYPEIRPEYIYCQFSEPDSYGIGIICIFIFMVLTLFFSRKLIFSPKCIACFNIENVEYKRLIAAGAPIVYAIIFGCSFSMGNGERGATTALNEYRTIIAIIGCYYAGARSIYKYVWTLIIGVTSVLVLLSGNRVDMFGSIIALIIFWYGKFINYKKILIMFPFVVVLLAAVGFCRSDFSFDNLGLKNALSIIFEEKLTYEGAVWGYMPSLAVIELTDMVPEEEKKELLLNHLSYIFTLGAAGKDRADLSTWSRDYYFHVWGFISPIYFYFWFLYLGPVIYALLVNFYSQIYQKMIHIPPKTFWQRAKYILSIYFVCNVARWYAYGPMALLRGMFVCFVIFSTIWGSVFMLEMCTHKKQGDILI